MNEEIVITGCGVISPLGHSSETLYQSLIAGESAVQLMHPESGVDGRFWLGAHIHEFDPKQHVQPRKAIKVMCREIQIAYASAMQACAQAGIVAGTIEPDRIGTVFGSEIFFSELQDVESIVRLCLDQGRMKHEAWSVNAMESMYPLWMLKSLPNMAACHVGIALDARGPNNTITTESTSGLAALLEAINVIQRGQADVMVVASTSSRISYSRMLQRYESDFSLSYSDPSRACRPYDRNRDGTVTGEGAAGIVIEKRSVAEQRKATILGKIESWANVFSPSRDQRWSGVYPSTRNALRLLLDRASIEPDQIDHVNGGANGTVTADAGEAHAIHELLPNTPVVSYRGGLGDAICSACIIDMVASLIGMRQHSIAATTNHEQTGSDCPVTVISGTPKPRTADHWIKLAHSAFGNTVGILVSSEPDRAPSP